jgi:hypothetical protein
MNRRRGLTRSSRVKASVQRGRLIGFSDLVEDVSDLVRPVALDGDAGQDRGQGCQQAGAAIDAA